jgi:hypothetical protein
LNEQKSALTPLLGPALVMAALLACKKSEDPPPPAAAASGTPPVATPAAPGAKTNLAGSYDATGTNSGGGGAYKANLVVTARDDVYQFSWESGGKKYEGVGVVTGNTVAVSFTDGADGKGCGVVLYKIGADGSLDGKAGYWGVNSAETEKGTRKSGSSLEGTYDVAGTNVEQKEYKGTLEIKQSGVGYAFKWNAGGAFEGFGVKQGDNAVVGFGGKQCGFVAYDIKADGTLDGKWGGQGSTTLGTETAKKK